MSSGMSSGMSRGCIIERSCRVTPDRHQADKRQAPPLAYTPASGSKQAARATPTARSACFVPQSADQDFTQQMASHRHPRRVALNYLIDKQIDI